MPAASRSWEKKKKKKEKDSVLELPEGTQLCRQ